MQEISRRGWNQSELAVAAGVTRTAISDVLSGRRNPGVELCSAIARALHLPPEIVFRRAGLLPPVSPEIEDQEEFVFLFSQLPPEERREILEFLRFKRERLKSQKAKEPGRTPARMPLKEK